MKWASKLTDNELREVYRLLSHDKDESNLHISKCECEIFLECRIDDTYDTYVLTDFYVRTDYLNDNNKGLSEVFREYMYKKFGNEYAKDYLFNYYDLSDVRLVNRD